MKWIKVRFNYIITAGNYFHLVPHGVLLRVFFLNSRTENQISSGFKLKCACMRFIFSPPLLALHVRAQRGWML